MRLEELVEDRDIDKAAMNDDTTYRREMAAALRAFLKRYRTKTIKGKDEIGTTICHDFRSCALVPEIQTKFDELEEKGNVIKPNDKSTIPLPCNMWGFIINNHSGVRKKWIEIIKDKDLNLTEDWLIAVGNLKYFVQGQTSGNMLEEVVDLLKYSSKLPNTKFKKLNQYDQAMIFSLAERLTKNQNDEQAVKTFEWIRELSIEVGLEIFTGNLVGAAKTAGAAVLKKATKKDTTKA